MILLTNKQKVTNADENTTFLADAKTDWAYALDARGRRFIWFIIKTQLARSSQSLRAGQSSSVRDIFPDVSLVNSVECLRNASGLPVLANDTFAAATAQQINISCFDYSQDVTCAWTFALKCSSVYRRNRLFPRV